VRKQAAPRRIRELAARGFSRFSPRTGRSNYAASGNRKGRHTRGISGSCPRGRCTVVSRRSKQVRAKLNNNVIALAREARGAIKTATRSTRSRDENSRTVAAIIHFIALALPLALPPFASGGRCSLHRLTIRPFPFLPFLVFSPVSGVAGSGG
jgi:hypothetical protein